MRESVMKTYKEEQLAKILNQSVQTLRNHRFLGKGLPYIKLGRSVRYLAADVERYLQESATLSQPWFPPRYQTASQKVAFRFAKGGFKTLVPGELLSAAKKTVKKQRMKPAVDVLSCVQAIETGADVHNSMNSIIAHLAAKGVSEGVIEHYVALVVKHNAPREKVNARLKEIPRSLAGAVKKYQPERGSGYEKWKYRPGY